MEKYLPKNSIGAELGVLQGNFSEVLLKRILPHKLYLIDPWYLLESHWSWMGGNNSTIDALIRILEKYRKEIESGQVEVHVNDDIPILTNLPDNHLDWAYIDSSHSYAQTKRELALLKFKVKDDGIICGDDWRPDPDHRHHGVYKAVQEFINENNFELIYSNEENLQWFIRRS